MDGSFERYIASQINLTPEEIAYMRSLAIARTLRRKKLILHEGEICKYKIFVVRGLLKNYRVRDDGKEYILRFAPENSWTTDNESYTQHTPSKYNIEALEDSELLLWSKGNLDALMAAMPALKVYVERFIAVTLNASYDRILANISYTSEEKYDEFVTTYPDLINRVPLHLVASYLGVSRETLTRIRQTRIKD